MNSNRLPLVGFIIMMIIAVFALAMQQQAINDVRAQMTLAANANDDRGTAVALAQVASATQGQAESGQATAQSAAQAANTAQSTAQAAANTAAAQLADAGTRSADAAATSTAAMSNAQATATMQVHALATIQAESTAELATLQGQMDQQATQQADLSAQLGTATAQVDLAEFARKVAEDDRSNALNQLWDISTRQAVNNTLLATAQAVLTSAPPATEVPSATNTPELQATTVNDAATPAPTSAASSGTQAQTFVSTDKKVQVSYPAGWFAQEAQNGRIVIVNQQSIFSATSSKLEPGQFEMDILAGSYTQFGVSDNQSPEQLMTVVTGNIQSQQPTFKVGDSKAITVGSYKAAQVLVDDGQNDLIITILQLSPKAIALTYSLAAKGEGDTHMENLLAIAASITYTE